MQRAIAMRFLNSPEGCDQNCHGLPICYTGISPVQQASVVHWAFERSENWEKISARECGGATGPVPHGDELGSN